MASASLRWWRERRDALEVVAQAGADQGVAEPVGVDRHLVDQAGGRGVLQVVEQVELVAARGRGDDPQVELEAGDGGHDEGVAHRLPEPGDPALHRGADAGAEGRVVHHGPDEQGVAGRRREHRLHRVVVGEQLPDRVAPQPREPQHHALLRAGQGDQLRQAGVLVRGGVARRDHQGGPTRADGAHEVAKHLDRGVRRPVGVVHHQQVGPVRSHGRDPRVDRVVQPVPLGVGVGRGHGPGPAEAFPQLGDQADQLARGGPEDPGQLLVVHPLGGRPKDLHERLEGHVEVLVATAVHHGDPLPVGQLGKVGGQPGLADARLAEDPHHPRPGPLDDRPGGGHLLAAAHEGLPGIGAQLGGEHPGAGPGQGPAHPAVPARRLGGLRIGRRRRQLGDEAVAAPVHGGDRPLGAAVVAQRGPGGADPAREGGLAHEAVTPHLVQQLFLRHQLTGTGDQVEEHVVDLGLEGDRAVGAAELRRGLVEQELPEAVHAHGTEVPSNSSPLSARTRSPR